MKVTLNMKLVSLLLAFALIPLFMASIIVYSLGESSTNTQFEKFKEIKSEIKHNFGEQSKKNAEEELLTKARFTAKTVSASLRYHSNQSIEELSTDEHIRAIAVQQIGDTGYTAVYSREGVTWFHPNPAIIGIPLSSLADKLPSFWALIQQSFDGTELCGYYEWEEADGRTTEKFMCMTPVPDTEYMLAATTYIKELEANLQPTLQHLDDYDTETRLLIEQKNKELFNSTITLVILIIIMAIISAFYLSKNITKPINDLSKAMSKYKEGKRYRVKVGSHDEIGELARNFNKLIANVERLTNHLQEEVKKQTEQTKKKEHELEKSVKQLKDNKEAMMNIMEDLNEANEKLKDAAEQKSAYLRNIAHELKTPLTVMQLNTERLLRQETIKQNGLSEKNKKIVTQLQAGINRFKKSITHILNIERLLVGKARYEYKEVDLNSIIKTEVEETEALAKNKDLKLKTELKKLPKTSLDSDKMKTVMRNLLSNAIKFTDKGSVTVRSKKVGDKIRVEIEDTGSGIPKEAQDKIFTELFYQVSSSLSRQKPGSGIGLKSTYQIINARKGKIWVESEVGKGSTFIFTIPIKFKPPNEVKK